MSEINWKNKYMALKAKFMDSVDIAFRLGYEQGTQQAQQDAMLQQQQQEAEMMQQQAQDPSMGGEEDPNAQPEGEQPEQASDSAHPGGSELDQHISTLESMVQKGELDMASLSKALEGFKSLKKTADFNRELKKSAQAIPAIAKALHKPAFKMSQQANHNLSVNQKKAVSMQEEIVSNLMKTWAEEESRTGKDILNVLSVEGLVKKD